MNGSALLILVAALPAAIVQAARPAGDNLLVYGDGFIFSVKEPRSWHGDTVQAAAYDANIVFFPSDLESRDAQITIRVRLNEKVDENTKADLEYDMTEYKKKYPGVRFSDIKVSHPMYLSFSKLFFVPGEFYEYVTYLNPGKSVPFTFSLAMSVQRRPATDQEIHAFGRVVDSVVLLKPAVR